MPSGYGAGARWLCCWPRLSVDPHILHCPAFTSVDAFFFPSAVCAFPCVLPLRRFGCRHSPSKPRFAPIPFPAHFRVSMVSTYFPPALPPLSLSPANTFAPVPSDSAPTLPTPSFLFGGNHRRSPGCVSVLKPNSGFSAGRHRVGGQAAKKAKMPQRPKMSNHCQNLGWGCKLFSFQFCHLFISKNVYFLCFILDLSIRFCVHLPCVFFLRCVENRFDFFIAFFIFFRNFSLRPVASIVCSFLTIFLWSQHDPELHKKFTLFSSKEEL